MGSSDPGEFDVGAAARRIRSEEEREARIRLERFRDASRQVDSALAVLRGFPSVRRVILWGSILRPERFSGISDIDICVEGVTDPKEWSRLEQELLQVITLPLDLVSWESLMEPHRESIVARGKVMYEQD